jgi:hypothetical protein
MYVWIQEFDMRYVFEYFRLSWTLGAGERPSFIQFFALCLTIIICAAIALGGFIRRKLINARAKRGKMEK